MAIPEIDDTATRNAKNGPNFLGIVLLSGVVLIVILLASYFTVDWAGKRIVKRDHRAPNARLMQAPARTFQA